ncbi:MAG: LON peptidase substrate-binding domain-containing protein [Maricaulaceae bacterium]|jgi:Lon protease-like protein
MPVFAYRKPRDLPSTLPVFPLDGALLLPRANLPLNIFEPRYLNMIDDALAGPRLIGMIQTRPAPADAPAQGAADPEQAAEPGPVTVRPALQDVGCAGRLTGFSETSDGRYLISLTGICRFHVDHEIDADTPYRQVRADYDPFMVDFAEEALDPTFAREELLEALRAFLTAQNLAADWSSMQDAPTEALVNSLAMACPFEFEEKQALLEAGALDERCEILLTLLRLRAAGPAGGAA